MIRKAWRCFRFNTTYEIQEKEYVSQDDAKYTDNWFPSSDKFNVIAPNEEEARGWLEEKVFRYSSVRNVEIELAEEIKVQAIIEKVVR